MRTSFLVIRIGRVQGIRVPILMTSIVLIRRKAAMIHSRRSSSSNNGSPPETRTSLISGVRTRYSRPARMVSSVISMPAVPTLRFRVQKRQYMAHWEETRKRARSGYLCTRFGTGLKASSANGSSRPTASSNSCSSGTA